MITWLHRRLLRAMTDVNHARESRLLDTYCDYCAHRRREFQMRVDGRLRGQACVKHLARMAIDVIKDFPDGLYETVKL